MSDIWIVFSGRADVAALKILKPGFRHCFAIIRGTQAWLSIDPMLHRMEVLATNCASDFDLPAYLQGQGYRVLRAPDITPAPRIFWPMAFTCVEAMKRLIGLHDWRILTPHQLYRRLLTLPQG